MEIEIVNSLPLHNKLYIQLPKAPTFPLFDIVSITWCVNVEVV